MLCNFRVDYLQSFKVRNLRKRMVRDDKMVERILARQVEGDGELQGIQRSQTSYEAVPSNLGARPSPDAGRKDGKLRSRLPQRRASSGRAGFRRSVDPEFRSGL